MPITIETATINHLNQLCEIEKICFKAEAFTKQQIASLLADYNSVSLVAKENNHIVGFIIGSIYFERNALTGHILTIDVLPVQWGKGIGTRLLREIEELFKAKNVNACRLEVREDNLAAINLYEKFGYKVIGKLKSYYDGADGIYLRKTLT
ncbi:MAG TPA: ribosomal protein S18-alanine N-acetyltransferase [Candidatus Bathyarchaeia archaeon]|nr:ribosomal protein S18-alanine N-acetyltransferase [Candidatus Bathyarchaeia archaeon]